MSVKIAVSGAAREAVDRIVPELVSDLVASRITGGDSTLWGTDAEEEAGKRLGWVEAVSVSTPLVPEILALRDTLRAAGVNHFVLGGMGGSSLAPEVITKTAGVELTVLDATDPSQVLSAINDRLETTAVVISSKSGGTTETDSQKRVYEAAFRAAGIDPLERIIVVTDPGSPLDTAARADGYRVFNADPTVGGRYSALTAFGLVPSGLAGVDIQGLLDEADAMSYSLALDEPGNPGLVLGAAIAGARPLKDKLGIVSDGTHIVGFGDWIEQLIAESTGKIGKGILPVVLTTDSPELGENIADLQVLRLVGDYKATEHLNEGDIEITGTLGALMLTWEYAVVVAGRLLGINPFDQPDVESAKKAARGLLDATPSEPEPLFVDGNVEVRATEGLLSQEKTLAEAVATLLATVEPRGYVAVMAYLDRLRDASLAEVRPALAKRTERPTTFGWGPRFLHSTGQFHKGGPAVGTFLQITGYVEEDLAIPDRPFTFGTLITAQAMGDAQVLADHGRPVLRLHVTSRAGLDQVKAVLR
ncbi:MAG: glucose-6-phosphate isomerase [Microbacteriaceae bacterium]|nr:glucose-6-phosphate isomerase [Microbacteriaceae bacterium]